METAILEQLERLKAKDKFPPESWDERDVVRLTDDARRKMNAGLNQFISFLQQELMHEVVSPIELKDNIQEYIDLWDTSAFNTDEIEHMLEIMCEAIRMVHIDCDDLVI